LAFASFIVRDLNSPSWPVIGSIIIFFSETDFTTDFEKSEPAFIVLRLFMLLILTGDELAALGVASAAIVGVKFYVL
jgi:hypothetical protein